VARGRESPTSSASRAMRILLSGSCFLSHEDPHNSTTSGRRQEVRCKGKASWKAIRLSRWGACRRSFHQGLRRNGKGGRWGKKPSTCVVVLFLKIAVGDARGGSWGVCPKKKKKWEGNLSHGRSHSPHLSTSSRVKTNTDDLKKFPRRLTRMWNSPFHRLSRQFKKN